MTKLWDKRENESDAAYARFLIYRNLGVGRSLDAAYRFSLGDAAINRKRTQPTGTWTGECSQFEWKARADAWDVEVIATVGYNVVVKYIAALDLAFQRVIEQLQDGTIKPKNWDQLIESLTILGNFIPQETVASIRQNIKDDSVPALGTGNSTITIESGDSS